LGVKITSANYPPSERAAYISWCSRNSVSPFDADHLG
jgi:hypothetical protein